MKNEWFVTSKDGLAKQARERGVSRLFLELVSNALDEVGVTDVRITVEPTDRRSFVKIAVEDNSPTGFCNLSDAYTMFAQSYKRENPKQRGQFNIGEKTFLSICENAAISTTTGTIVFDKNGRHEHPRKKRATGTRIEAECRLSKAELIELDLALGYLLLPDGISVNYNGTPLNRRQPIKEFTATLPTPLADAEGVMRPTARKTVVQVYDVHNGEKPHLYELGIPVVETDIRWHVNVTQKIPLNHDRDNVTPAYLRKLSTAVAEAMQNLLTSDDANGWCNDVLADRNSSAELTCKIMDERYGQDRASYDPTDLEANSAIAVRGGTIIHGRSLTKEQWTNVKAKGTIQPAGQVCPTPKPYSDDPDAVSAEYIKRDNWTSGMANFHDYLCWVASTLMGVTDLTVRYSRRLGTSACYCKHSPTSASIDFNVGELGIPWFDTIGIAQDSLMIHEFAHHFAGNHLSHEFHAACCDLGAKLKHLALEQPEQLSRLIRPTGDSLTG